jgi:Protein of unknown function (DUF2442)
MQPYKLLLKFDDGAEGQFDLADAVELVGVFEPIKDPEYFAQVTVNREIGRVVWPNGADLDPIVLHSAVTGQPIDLVSPSSTP